MRVQFWFFCVFLVATTAFVQAADIVIEAETRAAGGPAGAFDLAARVLPLETASGGLITALGQGEWAEYSFAVPKTGNYEVLFSTGGNDSRQAGLLRIDGGPAIPVEDSRDRLTLETPATEEQRRRTELIIFTQPLGVVFFEKGRHVLRVEHAGRAGFSSAFGVDAITLRPTLANATLKGGDHRALSTQHKSDYEPPPRWWQREEVYAGLYDRLTEDNLKRLKSQGIRVVVVGCEENVRSKLKHWTDVAHDLGLKLLPYVSLLTWRWRFDAEPGRESTVDAALRESFEYARRHDGDIRYLEYWALIGHPDWMLLNEDGKSVSPFSPDYQSGSMREVCHDVAGAVEAGLALVKSLMDDGADGIFFDNLHCVGTCCGDKLGQHKHLHPDWTNAQAYRDMLRQARALIKSYGKSKIAMLNPGNPNPFHVDAGDSTMWESFLFSGGERPLMTFRQVLDAEKHWRPFIEAGGSIAALSYFSGGAELRKRNAFYAYACAKLCRFQFSDWGSAEDTGAEALYGLRLGKDVSGLEDHGSVWVRRFEKGFVVVNAEGEGQPWEAIDKLAPRRVSLSVPRRAPEVLDLFTGQRYTPASGQITVAMPAFAGRVFVLLSGRKSRMMQQATRR